MDINLHPCPICGNTAIDIIAEEKVGDELEQCSIHCPHCGAKTGVFRKMDDAIYAWNENIIFWNSPPIMH